MVMRKLEDNSIVSRLKAIPDVFSIKVNQKDKELLLACMDVLEQPKHSTAVKQLMYLGAKVVAKDETKELLAMVFENKRKNKRLGYDVEYE